MKSDATPAPRRRQPILLERLEGRLLFDAVQLAPSIDATQPAMPPSVSDVARAMDFTEGSHDSTPQAALSAAAASQGAETSERALAFPGASGMGAYAQGGRGGDVFHVTSLDDYGAGTLREGVNSATGPRTIVFDVSGTIELSSKLVVNDPYLTIAGQTAPGDGITLKNQGLAITNTHDIIVRYMRFRPGDTVAHEEDSLLVYSSHDIMIDHISASWAVDETIDTSGSDNVTIQWSIIGEALHDSSHRKGPHSMGSIHTGGGLSLHHNLFISNNMRSPLVLQQADVVNNVMYNWGTHGTIAGWSGRTPDPLGITQVNLQGNYYIAGPSTTYAHSTLPYLGHEGSQLWQSDNMLDSNRNGVLDGVPLTTFLGSSEMVDSRFEYSPVPVDDPLTAYHRVLDEAGASLSRDAVDERLVNDVVDGTGSIVDSQDEVGGWPVLQSTVAPQDSDGDGMPDAWENAFLHLNSLDATDGNGDANGDGLTHLEDYLAVVAAGDPALGITGPSSVELGEQAVFTWNSRNPLFNPNASHTFEVDWDSDGQTDETWNGILDAPAEHAFDRVGPHDVAVTWTGPTGQSSQAEHRVNVTAPTVAPEIDLQGPTQIEAGTAASFTIAAIDGSASDAQSYTFDIDWDNDRRVDQQLVGTLGLSIEHRFETSGVYTVTATLTDAGGRQTTSNHEVTVTQPVRAPEIDLQGPTEIEAGAAATFTIAAVDNSVGDAQSYTFDIDWDHDGRADQQLVGPLGLSIEHRFETSGVFTITATLTDTGGRQTTSSREVTVTQPVRAPEIDLQGPTEIEAGAVATFTIAAVDNSVGDAQSYTFDIDWDHDGRADQQLVGPLGLSIEHRFETSGVFTITATLTDAGGRQTTSNHEVTVTQPIRPPEIDLQGPRQVEADVSAVFTVSAVNETTNSTQSYAIEIDWDNDGRTDQQLEGPLGMSVEHRFNAPGVYAVTATLTDADGRRTVSTHEVEVTAPARAPEIDLQGPRKVEAGVSETFTLAATDARTSDLQSYAFDIDWDGDGSVDQLVHGPLSTRVQHAFEEPGTYVVEAVLTDSRGRHSTSTHVVEVTAPLPAPEIDVLSPRQVLVAEPAIFTVVAANGATGNTQPYTFDIDWSGDGRVEQRVQGPLGLDLEHTFDEPGTHVVEIVLTDARGRHTTSTLVVDVTLPNQDPPARPPQEADNPVTVEADATLNSAIRVNGPGVLEAGEPSVFTLTAEHASLNQEQTYLFAIDWTGDGKVDQIVEGRLGTQVEHVFDNWGKYSVHVSLVDQLGVEHAFGGAQVLVTKGVPERADRVAPPAISKLAPPSLAHVLEADASNGSTYQLTSQHTGMAPPSEAADSENGRSDSLTSRAAQDVDWQEASEVVSESSLQPNDDRTGTHGPVYDALTSGNFELNPAQHVSPIKATPAQSETESATPSAADLEQRDGSQDIEGEGLLLENDLDQEDLIWAMTSGDATTQSTDAVIDADTTDVKKSSDDRGGERENDRQPSAETRPSAQDDDLSRNTSQDSGHDDETAETPT